MSPLPALMAVHRRAAAAAVDPLLALTSFYGGSGYNTQAAGGEAGVATGFGTITLGRVRAVPTNTGVFRSKISATGWQQLYAPQGFSCNYWNGSAFIAGPYQTITPSDVGRAMVFVTRITATPGVIEQAVNAVWHTSTPAMSGYAAAAVAESIGNNNSAGYPSSDFDVTASIDFRGTPTRAQIDAYVLAARALGDLPTTFAGATITYRWSLKEALASTTVVHGQAGPATIADTVTGAAANAMTKTGTPTVRRTEASVDGRKFNALMNAQVGSAFRSAAGVGPRGSAAGHWAALVATLRASSSGSSEYLMDVSGSTDGFRIVRIPATDRLEIYCFGAVNITSGVANLTAADRDVPQVVLYTYDGTTHAIRLARGIVISGTGSYVVPSGSRRTTLLADRDMTQTAPNAEIYAAAAGDVPLTAGEIDAIFAAWDTSRTLTTPPAKTIWSVDVAQDVVANGGAEAGVPATLQDRVGTGHLAREGVVSVQSGPNAIRGLGPYAAGQLLAAALGIAGSPSGFHVVIDVVLTALPTSNETIACNAPPSATPGWYFAMSASGVRFVQSGVVASNYAPLNSGHVGTRVRIVGQYTGSALHIEVNGVAPADVASGTAYAAPSSPMLIGGYSATAEPFKSGWVEAIQGGNTVLTSGELTTTNANRTTSPPIIAGKTQKRWIFDTDIAAGGGVVPPSVVVERIGGAAVDELRKTGSGLMLTRRTERLFGYEATPIIRGARNWSVSNYLAGTTTLLSTSATYWVWFALIVHARVSGSIQTFVSKSRADGILGVNLYAQSNLGSIVFTHGNGGTPVVAPSYTIADADLGRVLVLGYQWTGTTVQAFAKRARNGGDVSTNSFAPWSGELRFGMHSNTSGYPGTDGFTVLGMMGGTGSTLTLAEYQAAFDAFEAEEDIVAVPGKTSRLWSIKRSQNGALQPTVDAQGSGETLAIVGAPTLSNIYTRGMAA